MRQIPPESAIKINIVAQKDDSATRLEKLQENYPEILGYGITEDKGIKKISVIVEKITPKLESLFREGIRGHEIRFMEVGKVEFTIDRTAVYRPIFGGLYISNHVGAGGTLGIIAYRKSDDKPFILSNCHVLANFDDGDGTRAIIGDNVYQPRLPYPGEDRVVGKLYDYEPWDGEISIDAAIAEPTVDVENFIIDIPAISGTAQAMIGMGVSISGAKTGYTTGSISSLKSILRLRKPDSYICVTFTDTIITTKMGGPGDSGSILMAGSKAVGLFFAGSEIASFSNEIGHVLDRFDLYLKPYDGYTTPEPDLCARVWCPDRCIGDDMHIQSCDPTTGECVSVSVIPNHEVCLHTTFIIGDIAKFTVGPGNWVHGRIISVTADDVVLDYGTGTAGVGISSLTFVKHCSEVTADDPVWWHCDGEQPPEPDDLCEGVVCGHKCFDDDLHETSCDEGVCVRGVLIEEDSAECGYVPPDPDPDCYPSETQTQTCWGGSTIVTHTCVDGKWKATGITCPDEPEPDPEPEPDSVLILIIIAITAYALGIFG